MVYVKITMFSDSYRDNLLTYPNKTIGMPLQKANNEELSSLSTDTPTSLSDGDTRFRC